MKRILLPAAVIISSLLNFSCKEDFSPKTEFKEKYVLNCIIDLDYDYYTNTQVYATVSRLYDVNGYNPSANHVDPTVSGAEIVLNYGGLLYPLQEYTDTTTTNRYNNHPIYYSSILQRIYPNYYVYLTAKMPDGTVLTAQTQLLETVQLKYSYLFRKWFTTFINRFYFGNAFTITWGKIDNRLFFPHLLIPCFKPDSTGKNKRYYKEVPCYYVKQNGNYKPIYPTYTMGESVSFYYSAIDSAMAELSKESIDKGSVGYIIFQLVEFDSQLSKYYQGIHGSLDPYSIRLDESVYSNVKGGLGIFGSRRIITNQWYFDSTYVRAFGLGQ